MGEITIPFGTDKPSGLAASVFRFRFEVIYHLGLDPGTCQIITTAIRHQLPETPVFVGPSGDEAPITGVGKMDALFNLVAEAVGTGSTLEFRVKGTRSQAEQLMEALLPLMADDRRIFANAPYSENEQTSETLLIRPRSAAFPPAKNITPATTPAPAPGSSAASNQGDIDSGGRELLVPMLPEAEFTEQSFKEPNIYAKKKYRLLLATLRWIGVLPAAVLAYFLIQIPVLIGNIFMPMPGFLIQLFRCGIGAYAFVMAGTMMAPAFRFRTALGLSILFCSAIIGLALLATLDGDGERGPLVWLYICCLVSVVAALQICMAMLKEEHARQLREKYNIIDL